jgi:endogenous inhibitor of DNA gyrase (YacG/DUF329 family)
VTSGRRLERGRSEEAPVSAAGPRALSRLLGDGGAFLGAIAHGYETPERTPRGVEMLNPCPSCGSNVEQRHDVGRPRVYCSGSCRAAAARTRRAAAETAHAEETAAEIERAALLLASLRAAATRTPED